jgi:hypothetical protein
MDPYGGYGGPQQSNGPSASRVFIITRERGRRRGEYSAQEAIIAEVPEGFDGGGPRRRSRSRGRDDFILPPNYDASY